MILTYDAYSETVEEKQQRDYALATLSDQVMELMKDINKLKQGIITNPSSDS